MPDTCKLEYTRKPALKIGLNYQTAVDLIKCKV